jgi:hypothetical protein
MKSLVAVALLLCACAPVPTLFGVPRLEMVDAGLNVWRSAQPENAAEWATIRGLGVRRRILLRTPGEWPADPHDTLATAAGIEVIEIPMPPASVWQVFDAPSWHDTERAVSAMELGDALVGCLHGQDRTGWVVAHYKAEALGWEKSAAWNEALDRGMHVILFGQDWLAPTWSAP